MYYFLLLFIIADIKSNNNLGLCLMKLSSEIYFKICHYFEIIKNRQIFSFIFHFEPQFVTVDEAVVYVDKEQGIHYNKFKFPPNERYDKKKLLVFGFRIPKIGQIFIQHKYLISEECNWHQNG